jgi:hypothetical protein
MIVARSESTWKIRSRVRSCMTFMRSVTGRNRYITQPPFRRAAPLVFLYFTADFADVQEPPQIFLRRLSFFRDV